MKLFAAIALDPQQQARFFEFARALANAPFAARFVPGENYHITLAYLGPVEPQGVESVQAALREAAGAHPSFAIIFDRIAAFPHEQRPRVIFAGCSQRSAAFDKLCTGVRGAMQPLGFTFTDEGIAHVTLARSRGLQPLPATGPLRATTIHVREIVLFESVRRKQTTRYARVASFPLRAAARG